MLRKIITLIISAAFFGSFFFLLVPVTAVFLSNVPDEEQENISSENKTSFRKGIELPDKIDVWIEEKERCEKVNFEEYVCRVTASEMPGSFEVEALKAQSVAARTYAAAKIWNYENGIVDTLHPEAAVCNTTHCQVYKDEEKLIECHEEGWKDSQWKKIQEACSDTEGKILYYNGEVVTQPLFFSSSGGQTENSEDVFANAYPYLVSVSSPYEEKATHTDEEKIYSVSEVALKVKSLYAGRDIGNVSSQTIKILGRTAGGRVSQMQIGDGSEGVFEGTEVRSALGLSSTLFSISFVDGKVCFTSSGSGHGVGMSQYGADGMAAEGYDYKEILTHYYTGTEVY